MRKRFGLKGIGLWVVSGLGGLLLVVLVNLSPLYGSGRGIDLPVGWDNAETQVDCSLEGMLADACDPHVCDGDPVLVKGLPFAVRRDSQASYCGGDSNNLALGLNALVGIGAGLLYSWVASRRFYGSTKQTD